MEERMTKSILILCLVVWILVGQSTAKVNWTFSECYNHCTEICFNSNNGDFRASFACMKCDSHCRRRIYGEVCFFKWCWKVKKFVSSNGARK